MDGRTLICEAIEAGLEITFEYHGRRRVVEPYVLGADSSDYVLLLGFQRSDSSDAQSAEGWRHFRLREMREIEFGFSIPTTVRPDYVSDPAVFTKVVCRRPA